MQIIEGSRWGAFQCLQLRSAIERMVKTGAVTEIFPDFQVVCQCLCGKTVEFWASEMPQARWALPQDCGCGAFMTGKVTAEQSPGSATATVRTERVRPVGRPRGRYRESVSITLSHDEIVKLNDYVAQHQLSFSQGVSEILNLGFAQMELERLAES